MSKFSKYEQRRKDLRNMTEQIGLENTPVSYGAEKECHLFKNFVVFSHNIADKEPVEISDLLLLKLLHQKNIEYLRSYGIHTPQIIDIKLKGKSIIEIQERALGKVIAYTNESNILNLFGDKEMKFKFTSLKDMSEDYRSEFCSNLMKYNLRMQKQLKDAPLKHFIQYLSDFKRITEYGIDLDKHGENFLYDSKVGFSFIDLPAVQSSTSKRYSLENIEEIDFNVESKHKKPIDKYRQVPHSKILYDACTIFADSLKFAGHIQDPAIVLTARKNNTVIIEKLFEASIQAGYQITPSEYSQLKAMCSKFCYESPQLQD